MLFLIFIFVLFVDWISVAVHGIFAVAGISSCGTWA